MNVIFRLTCVGAIVCYCAVVAQTVPLFASQAAESSTNPPFPGSITPRRVLHKEDPKYPKEAKKRNLQGAVTLVATVEENGAVSNIAILDGDLELADEAVDALRHWRFEPYTRNGAPMKVEQKLTFNFDPRKKRAELNELAQTTVRYAPAMVRHGVYRVGGGVSPPKGFYMPDPAYSDKARKAKYQGVAVLSLIVGEDGSPRDIKVPKALGQGLDVKAVEAVQRWKFEPAMKDGTPVAVAINVEVRFQLY